MEKMVWICQECGSFEGYTHLYPKAVRTAFCRTCDKETNQTAEVIEEGECQKS